ncbi:MAG: pyridoxine 5'-phosphate synthase [Proteobacteria bacterium]|nr:pyridoxine 5'-phosphate synthase [Pseudomonadota bacterium]
MGLGKIRLGVNIDHVATLRNARGGSHPDPVVAVRIAEEAGADGITAHLREDRRHIKDDDIPRLQAATALPLNLEMAATDEMLGFALAHTPEAVCIVPENRQEITTEGGLDVVAHSKRLAPIISRLSDKKTMRIALFIEADEAQIEAAAKLGATAVEFHTGRYCLAMAQAIEKGETQTADVEYTRLTKAAALCPQHNLECHMGHGLDFITAKAIASIPHLVEVNIGHFLMGEAIMLGLGEAIHRMRQALDAGRDSLK